MTGLRGMALWCGVAVLAAAGLAAADCGPFGDPPRPMVQDLTQLTCAGGTMMAPWTDAGGTVRRACLYEPASASPATPLPLVVYLHPSLFTADTIPTATNLLDFRTRPT